MEHRYSHIISPIKIRNSIIKNRLYTGKAISQELQGPENFPAESTMRWVQDMCKAGTGIITTAAGMFPDMIGRTSATSEFDLSNRRVMNYTNRMIQRCHAYGTLVAASNMSSYVSDYKISEIHDTTYAKPGHLGLRFGPWNIEDYPEIPREMIPGDIQRMLRDAVTIKNLGFDMLYIYMGEGCLMAQALSPVLNQRRDEYGGPRENRIRYLKEYLVAVRELCGPNFILNCMMPCGAEPREGGYTFDDAVFYAKEIAPLVDIITVGGGPGGGEIDGLPGSVYFAKLLKEQGVTTVLCANGGFHDVEKVEEYLAAGYVDLIGVARPMIADPEYGKKLYAGAPPEDFARCIDCQKCHGAICSVNPRNGLNHVFDNMFEKPERSKSVAVIGGGPSGMHAAIAACDRGHKVTLFEEKAVLGGQLLHTDYMKSKHDLKAMKDYLIRQVEKRDIEVRLNTVATPEMIQEAGYDAVITGLGSVPNPAAAGIEGAALAWKPIDVFGHAEDLGQKVVVVGGGMIGIDTASYLVEEGHQVELLSRQKELRYDVPTHLMPPACWEHELRPIRGVTTTKISHDGVTYVDADGIAHFIQCDSVVLASGNQARVDEAYAFAGTAAEYFVVGECNRQDNQMYATMEVPLDRAIEGAFDIAHCAFTGYMAGYAIR